MKATKLFNRKILLEVNFIAGWRWDAKKNFLFLIFLLIFLVVNQFYDPTLMPSEFVMRGNAAIMKCSIPSFVADFVYVTAWVDDEGNEIVPSEMEGGESGFKKKFVTPRKKNSLKNFPILIFLI